MSKIGRELIESSREALAIARGEKKAPFYLDGLALDIAAIRKRLNHSQSQFAATFGLSPTTVRDREQGRLRPDRTAQALLTVIARRPEAVIAAVEERGRDGGRLATR